MPQERRGTPDEPCGRPAFRSLKGGGFSLLLSPGQIPGILKGWHRMRRNQYHNLVILAALGLLGLASVAVAQTGSARQSFAWSQAAPALTDAQGYTYRYYADGSATAQVFAAVVCTGAASPFTCAVPIPAFTPGNHSITLTSGNVAGESAKSSPFAFDFVVTPAVPANMRIQ